MRTARNHSFQIDETHDPADTTEAVGQPGSAVGASVRRVNVNFAPSAYEALERLAQRRGKTLSEILRDAIQLESWLQAAEDEGWHVLLERDGHVRELARI